MVYTPGHRGVAPNAVADAIAKAYLESDEDGGVLWEMMQHTVHMRPYVWGRADGVGGWDGPDDRRINVQVREGIMEWMRKERSGGSRQGRMIAGAEEGTVWGEVMREVAKGGKGAGQRDEGEEGGEEEEGRDGKGAAKEAARRREGREAVTYGMRTGEIEGIVHVVRDGSSTCLVRG